MLTSLAIHNYALIDDLMIDFSQGLSIITGETGAGKSILLGALGLVLGDRADTTTLKDTSKKCIVEAHFSLSAYQLAPLFEALDFDYEGDTIIRREILPSGKSRAFVNDTPVVLKNLSQLGEQLIDIHSQHQTLAISDTSFQFDLLDALAKNATVLTAYSAHLETYQALKADLERTVQKQREAQQQFDYNAHLLEELVAAKLVANEQEELEEKLEKITNVEAIQSHLSEALQLATAEDIGILSLLNTMQLSLKRIAPYAKQYQEIFERIQSCNIELEDISRELEAATEEVDFNPSEGTRLTERLQTIYTLQKKHYVQTIEELLVVQETLSTKVDQVLNASEIIAEKEKALKTLEVELNALAKDISQQRTKVIPELSSKLTAILKDLGMPQAQFKISLSPTPVFTTNGKDHLDFLFSANTGGSFGALKKVASGGELSRIMLAIKKVLSENTKLPTIIFDEIDTGVSGEISNKMASIMQVMSTHMQVISITHLPQIAAKGNQHYKVYKTEENGQTATHIKRLNDDERLVEIAEMLSGKKISETALQHAKELLN